jgi:hypothetical protein
MKLEKLGDLRLTYATLEAVDYATGGQLYGTMAGRIDGARLSGELQLTNLAARRPDNVNLPTLRGILRTDDGAVVWVEMDGIATLRPADGARVFVTTFRCRSGDERYAWVNTLFAVLEGVLDRASVGGRAAGELHECQSTASLQPSSPAPADGESAPASPSQ